MSDIGEVPEKITLILDEVKERLDKIYGNKLKYMALMPVEILLMVRI